MEPRPPHRGVGLGAAIMISTLVSLAVSTAVMLLFSLTGLLRTTPAETTVPKVETLAIGAADELLQSRNLRLLVAEELPNEAAEGIVIDQTPRAGSRVQVHSAVTVVVSAGTPTTQVPNVVGLPLDQGKALIERAGLGIAAELEGSRGDPGTIEAIQPPAQTEVEVGREVTLTVVPLGIEVPDLRGKTIGQARGVLRDLGLDVGSVRRRYDETRPDFAVLDQSPDPQARVPKGTPVDLTIND